MISFRFALKYLGNSNEEIVEVKVGTVREAKGLCDRILRENDELMGRLRRFNVYSSRVLESCRMCPCGFNMDMLACEEMIGSIDDV